MQTQIKLVLNIRWIGTYITFKTHHEVVKQNCSNFRIRIISRLDTFGKFHHYLQDRKLLWLPVCVPAGLTPSEKESTLKGKNLLPTGHPFSEGRQLILTELLPLKVHPFTWRCSHLYSSFSDCSHQVLQTKLTIFHEQKNPFQAT